MPVDGEERAIEVDSDWVEELAVEEDDSQAEDSVSCLIVCRSEQRTVVVWRRETAHLQKASVTSF